MSLMVILSMRDVPDVDPGVLLSSQYGKPKIEWVDAGTGWKNVEGALECWDDTDKVAEFARGEWVGIKKYSRDEAMADELMSDPRVKTILAEKLARTLKPKR